MGVYTGIHRDSWLSKVFLTVSLVGISLPTFLIGILLIYVFSVWLHVLPSFGRGEVVRLGFWRTGLLTASGLKALVLPAITLGLFQMTLVTRLVRAEMLEVLRTDYIKFARARGLPERAINFGHALKNTLVPVITVIGLQLGSIIAFAIITETVFQWPGMGLMFIQAVQHADIPVMAAYLLLVGLPVRADQLHRRSRLRAHRPAHPHPGARRMRTDRSTRRHRQLAMRAPQSPPRRDGSKPRNFGSTDRGGNPGVLAQRSRLARLLDSDLLHSFTRSKLVVAAALVTVLMVGARAARPADRAAGPLRPQVARACSMPTCLPPGMNGGDSRFLLGTDDQGRDILSTILYGTRSSLMIGLAAVLLATLLGVTLGLWAGYAGGRIDSLHHARRRRAAHLPRHPHRPADRRRDAGDLQELQAGGGEILGAGDLDRPRLLGAVRAHRARRDAGGAQQGVRGGGAADRAAARSRSCSSTSCPTS